MRRVIHMSHFLSSANQMAEFSSDGAAWGESPKYPEGRVSALTVTERHYLNGVLTELWESLPRVQAGDAGRGRSGKDAIIMQFISHRFPEDHDPTIEDAYKTQIRIDDEPANLDILDTAGQAEFTAMRDQYMRAGEGFIISYSITDAAASRRRATSSSSSTAYAAPYTRPSSSSGTSPTSLTSDRYECVTTIDHGQVCECDHGQVCECDHGQVSVEEGRELAREFQCPFFETSAAFRYYIDDVFVALVRQIRQREAEVVRDGERKTRRSHSFWTRLKAPFHRKHQSEH
ncbi:hypothetical protein ACEWY4_023633 [Coilia grayii]|uniref:Uncharacterized protein n=1 Tax=Coilia grayii TaxID=363190 RepID=A0ABD1IZY7_9TELE